MAIGLEGHTVSLTKNGYFKLIDLIRKYPSPEILGHLDEIKLDHTQARKMLAGDENDKLPSAWDSVKQFDITSQYALLLVSIIFSHKTLIDLFKKSTNSEMRGVVFRNDTDEKTYTNLAFALNEAGVALDFAEGSEKTSYDLSPIFTKNEIGPLVKQILMGHLENMGWKEPTSMEPFQRTLNEQLKAFEFNKVLGLSFDQFHSWLEGDNINKQTTQQSSFDPELIIQEFSKSVTSSGLIFSAQIIQRFIASLCTKPFVICSGLSGSGKTKLAQAFVHWICQKENQGEKNLQYCIVPVGADWTNREPLLGYPNALTTNDYVRPENGVLDLINRALKNQNKPYFLILDEMNLSHVERYFADFLSTMESQDSIPLHTIENEANGIPKQLTLPRNLFIIGTVNIDETTYMFSPKVLDRANTIEFRLTEKQLEDYIDSSVPLNMDLLKGGGSLMGEGFVQLATQKTIKNLENSKQDLKEFFNELKKAGAEFGYRTTSEIGRLMFMLKLVGAKDDNLLDIAIMQKLLPKLHGSRTKLTKVLPVIGGFCLRNKGNVKEDYFDKFVNNAVTELELMTDSNIKYRISFEKICRMYKNAVENGFASYAEA
jgi:hypothetical protein